MLAAIPEIFVAIAAVASAPDSHSATCPNLVSQSEWGGLEVHLEFCISRKSNSGVYLMGRYEMQVLDSFGKPDNQLGMGDCGAIYSAKVPSVNASKAPGEWPSNSFRSGVQRG